MLLKGILVIASVPTLQERERETEKERKKERERKKGVGREERREG